MQIYAFMFKTDTENVSESFVKLREEKSLHIFLELPMGKRWKIFGKEKIFYFALL